MDVRHGMGTGRGRCGLGRVCHRGDAAMSNAMWWVVGALVRLVLVVCVIVVCVLVVGVP